MYSDQKIKSLIKLIKHIKGNHPLKIIEIDSYKWFCIKKIFFIK